MRSFTHYSAIKMCLIAVLTVNSKKNTFSLACFLGQMFELQHFLCRRFKILHWRQLFSNAEGFNSACRFLYFLLSICYVLPLPSFCHNLDCGDTNTAIWEVEATFSCSFTTRDRLSRQRCTFGLAKPFLTQIQTSDLSFAKWFILTNIFRRFCCSFWPSSKVSFLTLVNQFYPIPSKICRHLAGDTSKFSAEFAAISVNIVWNSLCES